ncbi:MAG TPA: peptidoglycan-binding protein [Ramlibacter sp.]|nr:peptidoglycan-binding protein [Ramlibacter sp.]
MLLLRGSSGASVAALKKAVTAKLGSTVAAGYPALASPSDTFDSDVEGAVRRWQAGVGLIADGIVGPHCLSRLGLRNTVKMEIKPEAEAVRVLFPQTKPSNIVRYLPYVTDALEAANLVDRDSVLTALAIIRAETAGFVPIAEYPSTFNTLAGQPPYSAYEPPSDRARDLGNTTHGDGARYRGRGFVMLMGSNNYAAYGKRLGIPLHEKPDLANAPEVASVLLATFIADRRDRIEASVRSNDFAAAREAVNGGRHGLEAFKAVFDAASVVWPAGAGAGLAAAQPPAIVRKRVTRKDPPDLRDRQFIPVPVTLPDAYPPEEDVKKRIAEYRSLVLDQGADSSCTGYGLACVINFALWGKAGYKDNPRRVSARMLYNHARRYDEYAGEDYDGSSCRGALKGWFYNGVCLETDWPDGGQPKFGYVERARNITLGVYYRIDIKSVTDMQAAVLQSHAIYVSAFTHKGWDKLVKDKASKEDPTHAKLESIPWDGRSSKSDGHAFAIVGFNAKGFVIQNSWGAEFGTGGFAILSYADWLANGMDAWVACLGVPGVVAGLLGSGTTGDAGVAGAAVDKSKWWSPEHAMAHSIMIGDDGRVSRYQGSDETTRTLLYQACTMPDTYFRTEAAAKACGDRKRIVIYAHGGLNSEDDALKRAQAMGRFFWGNGCYPLFLVWRTGLLEALADLLRKANENQPIVRSGLTDVSDRFLEKTVGRGPGRAIWTDMKDKAKNTCDTSRACDLLVTALQNLSSMWDDKLEIHLVGHSAGSIILGHLLEVMAARGLKERVTTTHLFAPACTVQFANRYYAPQASVMDKLYMQVLGDKDERDDDVAYIYRKSLLYLVSQALEMDERTPLAGLANVLDPNYAGWDGSSTTMEALTNWRAAIKPVIDSDRLKTIVDEKVPAQVGPKGEVLDWIDATHGSFDNNVNTIDATLRLITGIADGAKPLPVAVDDLRGY